ncbi:MAG: FAD-dependent oxidoreductase [Deltaproteobacteria bacterium]|nr:FAD-dependent oxidoreductase [Deltaproteobacteria bacterium]
MQEQKGVQAGPRTGDGRMKADVVVIGAGAAGLSAALTASRGGAEVVVVEKPAAPGGLSLFVEGMFAVESSIQRRSLIGLTAEEAFKRHMETTQWRADGRLVRAFFEKSAETIDWLQEQGVEFLEAAAKNHRPIPGLYSAGNCAAGMYGSHYEMTHPGEAMGFAVNAGRIAGEEVLRGREK